MNYIEWLQLVFEHVARAVVEGSDPDRNYGVSIFGLPQRLGAAPGDTDFMIAVGDAQTDLVAAEVLRTAQNDAALTVGSIGQRIATAGAYDLRQAWPGWFRSSQLLPADLELLAAAVRICEEEHDSYAVMKPRQMTEVFAEAGRHNYQPGDPTGAFTRLEYQGLIAGFLSLGGGALRPTYKGVVLATQRVLSELQELISDLERRWEDPYVDFKREFQPQTKEDRGEFCKDILGLANTQGSHRRFLLIGWDNATRNVHAPGIDPNVREEQLQQILASYTDPPVVVRLQKTDYQGVRVGVIEVIREAFKLPYRFSRAIGRFQAGDMFVRHGTVTEPPTQAERAAIQEEGDRARQRQSGP